MARREFDLLRKGFNNARKMVTAGRSGTSRQEMVNQIGDMEGYKFLSWFVASIILRTNKVQLKRKYLRF